MALQKNIPDIPTARSTAVAPPDTSEAGLIKNLGEIAGNTVKEYQKDKLDNRFKQIAEATDTIGQLSEAGVTFDPKTGEIADGLSDIPEKLRTRYETVRKQATDAFTNIAEGVAQNALPKNAAAIELESTVKHLVNQTPGFGNEIRALAKDLAGYDPTGYSLKKILDVTAPKGSTRLSATEKLVEQATAIHTGLKALGRDVSIDTIMGNLAAKQYTEANADALDAQLSLNTIDFNQWTQARFVDRGPDLTSSLLNIAQIRKDTGGIVQPVQYEDAVRSQAEADKQALRDHAVAVGGIDPEALTKGEDQIDRMYKPILDSIKSNDLGSLLDNKLALIAKTDQLWGAQAARRITRYNNAFGPQITGKLIDIMSSTADPSQFELLYNFEPQLKELISSHQLSQKEAADGTMNVIEKVLNNRAITEDDLRFRPFAEKVIVDAGTQDEDGKELRKEFVKKMGASSPIRAASIISSSVPRAQATDDEVKFLVQQYKKNVERPEGQGLTPTLIDLVAEAIPSESDINNIAISNGKIGINHRTGRGGTIFQVPTEFKKLQVFIDAANNGYAEDMEVDKNTFAQSLVDRVKTRVDELFQEEQSAQQKIRENRQLRGIAAGAAATRGNQ